jgi:arylsulfatase A
MQPQNSDDISSRLNVNFVPAMTTRILTIITLSMTIGAGRAAEPPKKISVPNVVLIMVDDLGYGDLSCYGSELQKTPTLDKLAGEGIRLTSFYSGATVCTPSRMALLTGAYPVRVGWRGGVLGYKMKKSNGLAPEALTIAEVFKAAGYQTGMCGKWHLGDAEGLRPMDQGFDSAYYIKLSNNQCKEIWRGKELVTERFDNRRLTENFTGEAIKFIKANQSKPFFLYLPFTAPHFPAQSHPDWKGKSANGAFGDVVEEFDSRLGDILQTLRDTKLDKKTLVVFLSDNGPDPSQKNMASAKPYRGLKWSSLEGGTRVACIFNWPGVIPARQETDKLTAAIDLLPTITHACGIDLQKIAKGSPKIDGVNVWDTILGKKGAVHARKDLLYYQGWAVPQAFRSGDWKLYFDRLKDVDGTNEGLALFNLKDDPAEQTNLSQKHPDKLNEMKSQALELVEDIENNAIPLGGKLDKVQKPKRGKWLN